jgi:hypothetical protein
MLVVDDNRLHRLQRDVDYILNFFKALISSLLASCLLEVEPQILNGPL